MSPGLRMTGPFYYNKIMNDFAYSFYEETAHAQGDALWQDDGAKYHTSKVIFQWQKSMKMQRMRRPAQSPDLNPIKNLWQLLKFRICKRRHKIQFIKEMAVIVQEKWKKITQEDVRRVIMIIPKRCKECIRVKGGHTKY